MEIPRGGRVWGMMYPMMYELHHILRIINCSQRRHIVTRGEEGEEGKRERERECDTATMKAFPSEAQLRTGEPL